MTEKVQISRCAEGGKKEKKQFLCFCFGICVPPSVLLQVCVDVTASAVATSDILCSPPSRHGGDQDLGESLRRVWITGVPRRLAVGQAKHGSPPLPTAGRFLCCGKTDRSDSQGANLHTHQTVSVKPHQWWC